MALVSCKVVDATSKCGIRNVCAILQCKDKNDQVTAQFKAVSDGSGSIYNWIPLIDLMTDISGPEEVSSTSTISLTFTPPYRHPWARIRAEVDVTGSIPVHFTLSLQNSGYFLEYAYCAVELGVESRSPECEMVDVSGPISPLVLPPSIVSDVPRQSRVRSRKRKRSMSD